MSFSKLLSIFRNKVDSGLERAVENSIDVRREGDALIRRYNREIDSMQERAKAAMVQIKMQEGRIKDNSEKLSTFESIAVKALKAGEKGDAQLAASKIVQLKGQNDMLEGHLNTLRPVIESVRTKILDLENSRDELQVELQNLDLQDQLISAQKQLLGVGSSGVNSGITLKHLQDHIRKAQAKVDVEVEFKPKYADLTKKYEESATASVQDVLAEISKKHNIS